jgi:hypothetical protein
MVLDLIEELAARAFTATFSFINSAGKRRAIAVVLAHFAYYATKCALLMLYALLALYAFSATLLLCCPEIYYELAEMQCILPIHHLFFMLGTITSKETTCLGRLLEAFSPRRVWREVRRTAEGNAVEAACLILSLMPNRIRVARIAYDLVYGATKVGLTLFLAAPLLLALLPLLCLFLGVLA